MQPILTVLVAWAGLKINSMIGVIKMTEAREFKVINYDKNGNVIKDLSKVKIDKDIEMAIRRAIWNDEQ